MNKAPEIPLGVILQSVLINAEGETSGYRIYRDGRFESKVINTAWRFGNRLSATQLGRVVEAIADVNIEQLQSCYHPLHPATDSNILWVQVDQGGRQFAVEMVGLCEVPAIQTLSERIVNIFREKNDEQD